MGTSLSTILEPADLIIIFLLIPRFIYFCGFFAYDGLKNGVTLTHFGMRKGFIARLYGFFYLLVCLIGLTVIPSQARSILAVNPEDMKRALTFSESIPAMSFIFFGISLFIFLVREIAVFFSTRKTKQTSKNFERIEAGRKFTNWIILMPFSIGVQSLLGLPYFVIVGIFVFFTYFAPFSSPHKIKKIMSIPSNDKNLQKKSVSTA